jgi:hypothetical protein
MHFTVVIQFTGIIGRAVVVAVQPCKVKQHGNVFAVKRRVITWTSAAGIEAEVDGSGIKLFFSGSLIKGSPP